MRILDKAEEKMCLAQPKTQLFYKSCVLDSAKIASKTRKIYGPPEVHKSKRELGILIYPLGSQEITKLPFIKQQI